MTTPSGPRLPEARTLGGALDEVATWAAARPAILYAGDTLSYAQLRDASRAAARALQSAGVGRGDRVALLDGNRPDWIVAAFGVLRLGATVVPINTWYRASEIAWLLRHSGARAVVCAPSVRGIDFASMLAKVLPELASSEPGRLHSAAAPLLRTVAFSGPPAAGALSWLEMTAAADSTSSDDASPEDAAFILYTSGSTAEPKGVTLHHRGLVENGHAIGERRDITPDDRVWVGAPLFYALGAANAMPAGLTRGAALVLQDFFEAERAISVIESTQSTVYYGVGAMSHAILNHSAYARERVASLRKGNAGLGAAYKRLTLIEMGIDRATPSYGLTESYGNATGGLPDDDLETKLDTEGAPLPGIEIRIVDPADGTPLGRGRPGLILLRGNVTSGYFASPELTAAAFRADGWFDTGDLGELDRAGRLIFHARLKEVIKSNGVNVSPLEVERLLASHPSVRDAFVVGVPDQTLGELIVAVVVPRQHVREDELKAFIKSSAASFKVPHHIVFREDEAVPRLPSGKVPRYVLREQVLKELGRA